MSLVDSATRLVREVSSVAHVCGPNTGVAYLGAIARRWPSVLHSRSLAMADREMHARRARYHLLDVTVDLPGSLFSGAREMYCRRVYFANPHVTLRESDTVVDLGANMGLFTLLAAIKCKRVVAVEAQSGFQQEINQHLRAHAVEHKAVVEIALVGGASGVFADPGAIRSASHFEGKLPPHLSLPELMQRHGLDRIDFLKVDIEGSEFDVFRDDSGWLANVDRIAMEVHAHAGSPAALCKLLRRAGFEAEYRSPQLRLMPPIDADGYIYAYRAA